MTGRQTLRRESWSEPTAPLNRARRSRPAARGRERGCLFHLVCLLAALYLLGMSVYALLRYLIRDSRWWLVVLNDFAPFLFLPLLPLLLVAVLTRSRRLAVLGAVPCALFLYLYGGLFLPHTATAAPGAGPRLSLLTANLWIENSAADWVVSTLEAEAPDVIALQELDPAMAREIVARLGDRYPHRALHASPSGDGAGLLSRYPIVRESTFTLGDSSIICQNVLLDVEGQQVRVLNVRLRHAQYGWRRRNGFPPLRPVASGTGWQVDEVDDLLTVIDRTAEPLIVAGDFNLTDQSPLYRRLGWRLADTHREVGWGFGFTFPDFVSRRGLSLTTPPLIRIDYIWHSRHWQALDAHIGPSTGSDHRPVVGRFALLPAGAVR